MNSTRRARRDRRRLAQLPVTVNSAAPVVSSPWLVSPGYDIAIYAGSSLWGAALVLALGRWIEPLQLWYVFNIVFTAAHYGPTWLRAYADREVRQHHTWSLIVFPLAVIGFTFMTRDRPELLAFITFVWDRWHAVMQNYGFMRLYDAKAGIRAQPRARTDFALLMTTSFFFLSVNMGLFAPVLAALETIGLAPVTSAATIRGLQIAFGFATAIAAGAWIREALQMQRSSSASQWPRLAFLIALIAGHGIMNVTTNIFLLSAHEKVYHSLQYVALSWYYCKRRAERAPAASTGVFFRRLFVSRRWPVYLGVVAVWTGIAYAGNGFLGGGATGPGLFTTLIGGIALCHYYFDSFLWRVRQPEVRASL